MKKLFAAVAFVLTLSAHAEWRPIGTVQLADNVTLAQGLSKLGAFTGNAMLGMMAAGMLNDLPCAASFGPGRKGAATLYPFFVENGKYEFAVLYPVATSKAAFLKKFPGAVESNGLIRANCPYTSGKKGVYYAAFSKDGKWVGFSDNPQQARLALNEIATAEKSLDGDMVKLRILRRGLDEFVKGGEEEKDLRTRDLVGQLGGFVFGVRVSDRGLDFRGALKTNPGTEIAKVGQRPLLVNPLAFAAKDSIYGCAIAENCGQSSPAKMWSELKPLLEKAGIKLDWLEFVEKNVNTKFTIDIGRFLVQLQEMSADGKDKSDEESLAALKDYLQDHRKNEKFKASAPAVNCEFAFKGYAGKFLPAQRFNYTLPEAAEKRPFAVGFFSLYSLIRIVMPAIAKADPKACSGIETVIAALPEEGEGGMAFMAWTEKDFLRFFFRIGEDEFKAVSAGFAAFASLSANSCKDESNGECDAGADDTGADLD